MRRLARPSEGEWAKPVGVDTDHLMVHAEKKGVWILHTIWRGKKKKTQHFVIALHTRVNHIASGGEEQNGVT